MDARAGAAVSALADRGSATVKRKPFVVSGWGIYSGQKLLITCDSRASAEELLDPGETLVHVRAKCVPAKPRKKRDKRAQRRAIP